MIICNSLKSSEKKLSPLQFDATEMLRVPIESRGSQRIDRLIAGHTRSETKFCFVANEVENRLSIVQFGRCQTLEGAIEIVRISAEGITGRNLRRIRIDDQW